MPSCPVTAPFDPTKDSPITTTTWTSLQAQSKNQRKTDTNELGSGPEMESPRHLSVSGAWVKSLGVDVQRCTNAAAQATDRARIVPNNPFAFPPLHPDVQVPRSTGRARAAIPGGQMSEGTTPGKEEVESRREQRPRAMHDSMDGGVRTASGTAVEEQLPRSAGAAFTRPFVAARSCCARKPGLAFLRSAFLLHSEVQSRPFVVCPFAGQIVHWTICKSPAHPWQARSPR